MASLTSAEYNEVYYTSKWFYDLILAAALFLVILKKELAELAWVSYVLFVSLALFVILCFVLLVFDSRFTPATVGSDFWSFKLETTTISALSVTMLAYSFQQNVFPIFVELKHKSNGEFMKVTGLGIGMTSVIYFAVSLLGMFMFGSKLMDYSSILSNIGNTIPPNGGAYWEAVIVQISFMLVLTCHVPFIFFSGKEALCTIIDELDRSSISNALWHKLQTNEHFAKREDA